MLNINLNIFYDYGIETDINNEKAFDLYNIAAKGENVNAQKCLAVLYKEGKGVQEDVVIY